MQMNPKARIADRTLTITKEQFESLPVHDIDKATTALTPYKFKTTVLNPDESVYLFAVKATYAQKEQAQGDDLYKIVFFALPTDEDAKNHLLWMKDSVWSYGGNQLYVDHSPVHLKDKVVKLLSVEDYKSLKL